MRQTELRLTRKDRKAVEALRTKGAHMAREVNRAHILAALDRKIPENQIMAVLGVGRTAVWRTRAAYVQGGLEFALQDAPRTGKPKRYQTDDEAQVAALACSAPPEGAKRWTVALLTEAARVHPRMAGISRESVRRFLKKPPQALEQNNVVHRPHHRGISETNVRFAASIQPFLPKAGTGGVY